MLHLISGRPGHGKNIYALNWLEKNNHIAFDKESETFSVIGSDEQPLFFISFDGINIIDANTAEYSDLDSLPIDQESENKSIFPDGSTIVIDEAHRCAPKSQNKEGFTNFVSFLKIHRHLGFNIIFMTQNQKDLNVDIRNLIDNHYYVSRPFGISKSMVSHYASCETRETPKPVIVSTKQFLLDPRFFKIYKSASIHNYKAVIPKKYYVYAVLVSLFLFFVIYKASSAYDFFTSASILSGNKSISSVSKPPSTRSSSSSSSSVFSNDKKVFLGSLDFYSPKSKKTVFFYKYKYPKLVNQNAKLLSVISKTAIITPTSAFCYCTPVVSAALAEILRILDTTKKMEVSFHLVSFNDVDFQDFNLKYKFKSSHFIFNNGTARSNLFLFDFLKKEFKSFNYSKSSSLVDVGYSFESSFLTSYPKILRSFSTGNNGGSFGSSNNNNNNNNNNDYDDEDSNSQKSGRLGNVFGSASKKSRQNNQGSGLSSERVKNTDVGYSFNVESSAVSSQSVKFHIKQSHSSFSGDFIDEVPIVSRNSFKSSFELNPQIVVPLFSLNDVSNRDGTSSNVPFLSWLLPADKDDRDKNYRFFFSFDFVDETIANTNAKNYLNKHGSNAE